MDSGIKPGLGYKTRTEQCGLRTNTKKVTKYWFPTKWSLCIEEIVFWRHNCHLVKLRICSHLRWSTLEVRAAIVSYINSSFLAKFWFPIKIVIVKCLTGCCYLQAEAIDNFQLHMFENRLCCFISHYPFLRFRAVNRLSFLHTGQVTYGVRNMYLLTEWEGRTGKYLARGHGVLTERNGAPAAADAQ